MDIPNLTAQPQTTPTSTPLFSIYAVLIVMVLSVASGFWISRFFPLTRTSGTAVGPGVKNSTDNISAPEQLAAGKVYGNQSQAFKDSATGVVEKGSINGEGTHILNREGGLSQRASLTSSTVDLDLFVGKKVEIHGETNASSKTAWLLDVGNIKILE